MSTDTDTDGAASHDELAPPTPRPLPPPPTVRELIAVFSQRVALRHPWIDLTHVALVLAAIAGLGGMAWALWSPRAPSSPAPIRVVTPPSSTVAITVPVTSTTVPTEIIVDVAGAVTSPGPVRVRHGGRVADALAAAGGSRGDADLERVDRAAVLTDGQRIYVPRLGQGDIPDVVGVTGGAGSSSAPEGSSGTGDRTSASGGMVDINTAGETELDALPGVGPATAKAIVEYRNAHGRFTSVDGLLEVKGIGPAKMADLRPHVTV